MNHIPAATTARRAASQVWDWGILAFRCFVRMTLSRALPGMLGGAILMTGYLWYQSSLPPYVVQEFHEVDGVAAHGGSMDLEATVNHRRVCTTAVRRWLWRNQPGVVPEVPHFYYMPDAPFTAPVGLGISHYILTVPVPAYVPRGVFHYLAEPSDACASSVPGLSWLSWLSIGVERPRQSKDMTVQIIDPTPSNPAEISAPAGALTLLPAERSTPH